MRLRAFIAFVTLAFLIPALGQAQPTIAVSISPASLSFPSVSVGQTYTKRVRIENIGNANLVVSSVAIVNENPVGQFSAKLNEHQENGNTGNNDPNVIFPGDGRDVDVTFAPTSPAATASLQINDNASGAPHLVPLTGNGIIGGSDHPIMVIVTPTLNFSPRVIGESPDTLKAIFINIGTADLHGRVEITGPDALQFATEGDSGIIAPGDTADIRVFFNPTSPGEKHASLELTGNVAGSPFFIELSGIGAEIGVPFVLNFSGVDGLSGPYAVAFGGDGQDGKSKNLFIADTGNNRIVQWVDGVASVLNLGEIELNGPYGIAAGADSALYITDHGNNRLIRASFAGVSVVDLSSVGGLNQPYGIFSDHQNNNNENNNNGNNNNQNDNSEKGVVVADYGNGRIVDIKFNGTANVLELPPGVLGNPASVAGADSGGYITDFTQNQVIRVSDNDGVSIVDMGALDPALEAPAGVAVARNGDVFIAEVGNSRLLRLPGGHGPAEVVDVFQGLNPPGLLNPQGVAIDRDGTLIIVDTGHNRIIAIPGAEPDIEDQEHVTLVLGSPYNADSGFDAPTFGAPGDFVSLRFGLHNPTGRSIGGLQFAIAFGNQEDQNKLDFQQVGTSEQLAQYGFALYSNDHASIRNAAGEDVPAIRIVIAPQTQGDIQASVFPPGDIQLGSLNFTIRHQNLQTKALAVDPSDVNLLGTTIPFILDQDVRISDDLGQLIPTSSEFRDAAIHVGIHGDVSLDGTLDVRDVVLAVRVIVGGAPPPQGDYVYHQPISTAFLIADTHPDGTLNVLDAIEQINHILELDFTGPVGKALVNAPTRPVGVSLGAVQALADGQLAVPVMLDMDGQLAGAQFAVTFDPAQVTLGTPQAGAATQGVTLASHVTNGTLTFVLYSLTATSGLTHGQVALIPVTVRDGASAPTLTLTSAVLGTRNAQAAGIHLTGNVVKVAMLPTTFALKGNRPNPFNPSTTIAYEVPKAAHITLAVYNLLGQEVVQLVNEVKAAGRYTVSWNARNANGAAVASGVYLYRLTSSTGFTATHRMTLLK